MTLLLVAALAVTFHTVRRIWNHVKYAAPFRFSSSELRPATTYPWLRREIMAQLFESDPYLISSHSIFEPGVTTRIADKLSAAPWVQSVPYVRKKLPNLVELEIVPREPLIWVVGYKGPGKTFLADREGARLDAAYYDFSCKDLFIFDVTGVAGPAPRLGERWRDDAVRAAAAVAAALKRWPQFNKTVGIYQNEIVEIDVSNYHRRADPDDTNEIVLVTRHGSRIKWGRSPIEDLPLELAVEDKLKWLHQIYLMDQARKRSCYDIRYARFATAAD